MESYNELNKQLWGLVRGIKQCNFIPTEDKEDIVQSSFVKIIEKINEGILVDNYNEMRGYTFSILRNFCLQYHRDKDKRGQNYQIREDITPEDINDIEPKEMYRQILSNLILNKAYSDIQKTYVKLAMSGYTTDQIQIEMNISNKELGHLKRSLAVKSRYQLTRKPKYYIRKIGDLDNKIPCYTFNDIKAWFSDLTFRQINYSIDNQKRIGDYYIVRA